MTAQFTPTTPAKLVRADHVAQFGGGYRQISGPTIAEATVGDLMAQVGSMPPGEVNKIFFSIEGVINPLTPAEVSDILSR